MDSIIHKYASNQRRLLELELRSEEEEANTVSDEKKSQGKGGRSNGNTDASKSDEEGRTCHILRNLQVDEWNVGLMGRTIVTLTSMKINENTGQIGVDDENNDKNSNMLPAHRIKVGDEIEIMSKYNEKPISKLDEDSLSRDQDGTSNKNKNQTKKKKSGGVVSAVTDTMISVALFGNTNNLASSNNSSNNSSDNNNNNNSLTTNDQDEELQNLLGSPPLVVVPKSSVEVHKKMMKVLNKLEDEGENHALAGNVIRAVFDPVHFKSNIANSIDDENDNTASFSPFNPNLDESQIGAIRFCLQNQPISLIHGPPGTGKTTTVAELIHQAVHVHNMRVLVTAPSNVAVDNVLERLVSDTCISSSSKDNEKKNSRKRGKKNIASINSHSANKIRAVRLGHPARIQASILNYSLEALVHNSDGTEIVSDIRSELQSYLRVVSHPKSKGMEKRTAFKEMRLLRKEIREREGKVVQSLIANAQVVLATNVGAGSYILDKYEKSSMGKPFDLVIIDEAAQALEVSCWIPILRGKRVVLAGDHCQLPPTIKSSNQEVQKGLSKTMFERIMGYDQVSRMLQIQYRMHEDIANWASEAMYKGRLISHHTVKARKLHHLTHIRKKEESVTVIEDPLLPLTRCASLLLIDTAGCDMFECVTASGSRYNEGEAAIVERHVHNLLEIGLRQDEIAIITPYNGQVEILKKLLLGNFPKLEIRSVDGFQGGEREAVVLSLVRSSEHDGAHGIGFLRDKRRLNVAITRAKRQCAVICDSDTISQNIFLKGLVSWMESKGEYLSAMEYSGDKLQNNEITSHVQVPKLVKDKKSEPIQRPSNEQEPSPHIIISKEKDIDLQAKRSKADAQQSEVIVVSVGHANHEGKININEINKKDIMNVSHPPMVDINEKLADTISIPNDSKDKNVATDELQSKINFISVVERSNQPKIQDNIQDITRNSPEKIGNINSLLGTLARERQARVQVHAQAQTRHGIEPTKATKKKKSKGCKKQGGPKPKKGSKGPKMDDKNNNDFYGLDDMAFLDAQIEQVQTSHGRKVDASGINYKSIVNGILIAKPKQHTKKKDNRIAGVLNAKLKQAQSNRKAKPKKK